jgi:hypothetical protein
MIDIYFNQLLSQVDTFSFGMYIYELLTLHQPFCDLSPAQVKQMIVEGQRPPLTPKVQNKLDNTIETILLMTLFNGPFLHRTVKDLYLRWILWRGAGNKTLTDDPPRPKSTRWLLHQNSRA